MHPKPASTQFQLTETAVALAHGLLWLPHSRTLIAADIHLGYEDIIGAALPLWSTDESIQTLLMMSRKTNAHELVLLGDIIHSTALSEGAATHVRNSLDLLRANCTLTLIAGNHEGRTRGSAILGDTEEAIERDGWTLIHGDEPVASRKTVIGHLHPSLPLGGNTHAPAFIAHPNLIVVPAMTPYSSGLNVLSRDCTTALKQWVPSTAACTIVASTPDRVYPFGSLGKLRATLRTTSAPPSSRLVKNPSTGASRRRRR